MDGRALAANPRKTEHQRNLRAVLKAIVAVARQLGNKAEMIAAQRERAERAENPNAME